MKLEMITKHPSIRILFVAVACVWLSVMSSNVIKAEEVTETRQIRQIAVMPFLKGEKPENVETIMTCQLGRLCTEGDAVMEGTEKAMTSILQKALADRYGDRVLPLEKTVPFFDAMRKKTVEETPLDLAIRFGRGLNVGYVVVGNIWRFGQRSGNAVGSDLPASVAFNIHLIDVDRGTRIWKGSFEKTQHPLSDNLLNAADFFKQGGQWLTAEELALIGVKEILKTFPISK